MAAFYSDENFRLPVVEALRRLGHDVVTCQEAERAGIGIGDEVVLGDALAMERILLTQNRDDFKRLHRKGLPHCGIVVCTYDAETESIARRISDAVAEQKAGWQASSGRTRGVLVRGRNLESAESLSAWPGDHSVRPRPGRPWRLLSACSRPRERRARS